MCAIKGTFVVSVSKFGLKVFEAETFEITYNFSPFILTLP